MLRPHGSAPQPAPAPRLLIVEDEEPILRLLKKLLAGERLQIDEASSGPAGRRLLAGARYDLLITDLNLPEVTGLDLLRQAREIDPATEVIIITGVPSLESTIAAIGGGVCDYIPKPFDDLHGVKNRILRALDKRRLSLENRSLIEDLQRRNEEIARSEEQLRAVNATLEQRVQERTLELEEANRKLGELSITDDVTGLFNQRYLFPRLRQEISRARRYQLDLTVIMLDLDHFKRVNDEQDHLFGSFILRRVGSVLRDSVRESDIAVRYGGDEFFVLLPETNEAGALQASERIRARLSAIDHSDGRRSMRITASFGVAVLDAAVADGPDLLRRADLAMYRAKAEGRDRVALFRPEDERQPAPPA